MNRVKACFLHKKLSLRSVLPYCTFGVLLQKTRYINSLLLRAAFNMHCVIT